MPLDDEFIFDDEEFAAGAGINPISEAYVAVGEELLERVKEFVSLAKSGTSKEVAASINKIFHRVSQLSDLSTLTSRIVGPTGKVYNVFGQSQEGEDNYDPSDTMSQEELIERINEIKNSNTKVTLMDAEAEITKQSNIQDDGLSHGELDEIDW